MTSPSSFLLLLSVMILIYFSPPTLATLARKKNQYVEKTIVNNDEWKNAGIGEICTPEEELEKKLEALEAKNPNDDEARKRLAAEYCGATPKLACTFEIPDMKEVVMVCDCADSADTWDEKVQQCRRFAGRKQNCTDDSQCVTGSTCKNEALKLRDYSRWEAAVVERYNITTPRADKAGRSYGKVKVSGIDQAARERKRILSRISRNSYKEEVGECTCVRNELKIEFINKTDPCLARKYPPPLNLGKGHRHHYELEFIFFLCLTSIIWNFPSN